MGAATRQATSAGSSSARWWAPPPRTSRPRARAAGPGSCSPRAAATWPSALRTSPARPRPRPASGSTRAASCSRSRPSDWWRPSRPARRPCETRSASGRPPVAEVELPNPEHLEHHASKAFSRRVALITAIYAVARAVAALGSKVAMQDMLLTNRHSSDQWAFYQAKVIREHQNRGQKTLLEMQLAEPSTLKGPERAKVEAQAQKFAEEEKRYNAEKKDIEKEA